MKIKLLLLLTAVLFSSCMTLNKAKQKMADNPVALAEMCALHFPAADKFIKGDPVVTINETVRRDTVTIRVDGKDYHAPCPECIEIEKEITITDTIIRLDEASLFALLSQVNELTIKNAVLTYKNDDLKNEKRNLIFGLIGSGLGLLVMLWLRFK